MTEDHEYLFEDSRPEKVDWLDMIPADVLAAHDAEVVAKALEEIAGFAESTAAWTENNFLHGPNTEYAIRHYREMAEDLRERAAEYRED